MDWGPAAWWWTAAGLAVAFELVTGTFHLLMLAFGLAVGALAAHAGLGTSMQITFAAVLGGAAVAALVFWRQRRSAAFPTRETNRDVMLDIGERVHVERWSGDGSARVHYRGTEWAARYDGPGEPAPGEHVIHAVEGNCLILRR